ncbi:hypothetical protein QFC19_000061 [Naganishia cerealis]|uniref:Uncharacterized protein n=1 Tax=Naganishia cerealis TaxID=610337 RepID=A0ACC2WR08_9TREE|nr:hypothetical protein QFC19_000061 [Naganishia cerealis]
MDPRSSDGESRKRKTYFGQGEGLALNNSSAVDASPAGPPVGYPYIQTSQTQPSYPPQSATSSPPLPTFALNAAGTGAAAGAPTFVACTKCRHRKIKCGGQRPICENCEKKGLECVYDVVVKRRGPDKQPGGRMKKRQSHNDSTGAGEIFVGGGGGGESTYVPAVVGQENIKTEHQGVQVGSSKAISPGSISATSPHDSIQGPDVKPLLPSAEARPSWDTIRQQPPPVGLAPSMGGMSSAGYPLPPPPGHVSTASPDTTSSFPFSMPSRTHPTAMYPSGQIPQQGFYPPQGYEHDLQHHPHTRMYGGPGFAPAAPGYHPLEHTYNAPPLHPEHPRGMSYHQQYPSIPPPLPPAPLQHAGPYGARPAEHHISQDMGYSYHPSAPQLPPQGHMYHQPMPYPVSAQYQSPSLGGAPSRTPSVPQDYRTGESTPSVLELSRPAASANPLPLYQTAHVAHLQQGDIRHPVDRNGDGSSNRTNGQEVWSPSVMGKLGMADLVTGYDPVQHIAAGANLGLGLTVRSSSSNLNSENGDVSEEDGRSGSLQLVQHSVYTNGHAQVIRGEEAFAHGLVLERLPNTEYARESDWVWMTGLFSTNRAEGIKMLDTELRFFFDMNMQWFQFFNRSLFFTTLYHDVDRYEIQPALILSMLAITTLVKSAHQGPNAVGKQNAVTFADAARAMIQQSIVANKVDPTLAQAALVLMAFEFYPYPQHSYDRTVSAVHLFDSIAHTFQLLACDVSDERVSIFIPNAVPVLTVEANGSPHYGKPAATREEIVRSSHEAEEQEEIKELIKWSPRPQWPVHWSSAQVRQDEARRMCWTASSMVANFSLWTHTLGIPPLDLYISNPANYALFFPAEPLLVNKDPVVGKQTMWALYNRVVLLWHFTLKTQHMALPPERRNSIYLEIWHETHRIEEALFHIGMNAGQTQKWQARDWILNILALLTDNFTRFTPGMLDGKTGQLASLEGYRSWVKQQAELGSLLKAMSPAASKLNATGEEQPPAPSAILGRPFFAWPLLHMIQNALTTFELDHSRFETIKIAAGVLRVVKIISDAWPNQVLNSNVLRLQNHFNSIIARGDLPPDWQTRPILTPEELAALAELQIVVSSSPP